MNVSAATQLLIAEDEPIQRRVLEHLLRRAGYGVDTAEDGEEALAKIATGAYQILVTDCEMPKLDGAALCRRIRSMELPGYLYILILTGNLSVADCVAGLEAGADDYLRKPPDGAELLARLNAGRRIVQLEKSLREANARIHLLSITDGLLQIFNRRYLNEQLQVEIERARRYRRSLALVAADLDNFKTVNDRHGHQVGDQVLKGFADLVRTNIRQSSDWVARYGGEEFIIVLPESAIQGATATAEKLRRVCEATVMAASAGEVRITASFGVASFEPAGTSNQEQSDALLLRADTALYKSKAAGRNRVTAA
jgi:diguanylate cyclase (GGDEF)-like protein